VIGLLLETSWLIFAMDSLMEQTKLGLLSGGVAP
jgi:hypothetical protein